MRTGQKKRRSWLHSCLEASRGGIGSSGGAVLSLVTDRPGRRALATVQCCSPCAVPSRTFDADIFSTPCDILAGTAVWEVHSTATTV